MAQSYIKTYNFLNVFLLFCLVFGFKLPVLNSSYLAGLLALILLFLDPYRIKVFAILLKKKHTLSILFLSVLIIPISISIAVLHGTYDYSIVINLIGQFPIYISCLLVFSVIFPTLKNEEDLLRLIIGIFFVQAVINFIAFISPTILSIVQEFQYPDLRERAIGYRNAGTFRGLALSGTLYFGLSASFGLAYIFYAKYILQKNRITIFEIIVGLTILVGNFFVARTGFVGFLFAILLFFLSGAKYPKSRKAIKILIISTLSIIFILNIIPRRLNDLLINNILPFAFEFISNYKESGRFETDSTNLLFEMLQVPISFKTFFIGDGWFTNLFGGYYMETDSGYYRLILFGGFFYLLYFIYYQYRFFCIPGYFRSISRKTRRTTYTFIIVTALYLLMLHIKGLTLGYLRMILILLFFYFSFLNWHIHQGYERRKEPNE